MPKQDKPRTIDLRPGNGAVAGGGGSGSFDDRHLLRRDGSRSLYAAARWVWETGAEVAGTLRARGSGLLQVFGALFTGQRAGAHVGLFEDAIEEDAQQWLEATDHANLPFLSAGSREHEEGSEWLRIGYEGQANIRLLEVAGYVLKQLRMDLGVLAELITHEYVDVDELAAHFPMPVFNTLGEAGPFDEGQLFMVRKGVDSGAIYQWTRWGPEPVGGYHVSGLHNHESDGEGGQLDHGAALLAASLLDDDHPQYLLCSGRNGGQTAYGGTGSGDDLALESTSHATKGHLVLQPNGGNVGIGMPTPPGPNEVFEVASATGGRVASSDGGGTERRVMLQVAPTAAADYGRLEAYKYGAGGSGKPLTINPVGGGHVNIGSVANFVYPLAITKATNGEQTILHLHNLSTQTGSSAAIGFSVTSSTAEMGRIAVIRMDAPAAAGSDLAFLVYNSGLKEYMRLTSAGYLGIGTTSADRLLHSEASNAITAAISYAYRSSHTTSGTAAALFGVGSEDELEDAAGNMQVASEQVTLWATAISGSESPLRRWTTYPGGSAGPGYMGFWTWTGLDGTARTVIPNGAGDVTAILTIIYAVISSGGTAGGTITATPGGGAVDLYNAGGEQFTLTVAADGSVSVVRAAGSTTAKLALNMTWI